MATLDTRATPMHLWIVGALATLWNAFGAYDYTMTRLRDTDYLASMMPGVDPQATLAWIDAFPVWAQAGWGLGVWGGLVGSLLLLVKSRWAVTAFLLSFIGMVVSLGYQVTGAPPLPGTEGAMFDLMPFVIMGVGAALLVYAWAMDRRGVLR